MNGDQELVDTQVKKDTQKFPGKLVVVESDGCELKGNLLLVPESRSRPGAVICHGAAKNDNPIEYLTELQKFLAEKKINSLVLHTRGVGEGNFRSGGPYESTLLDRKTDLIMGLEFLRKNMDPRKLSLVVGSMSGEPACFAAEQLGDSLCSLVLIEPAAYVSGAERVPLGEGFRQMIRAEWIEQAQKVRLLQESPAFSALEKYNGPVMVAYGDKDRVIDRSVQTKYQEEVIRKGSMGKFVFVVGAGHTLISRPNDELYRQIGDFLGRKAL